MRLLPFTHLGVTSMKNVSRISILALSVCLVLPACLCRAGDAADAPSDEFFAEFLVGSYKVVGKNVNGLETYTGSVDISRESGGLRMRRDIQGKKTIANAEIARSSVDGARVLRVSFEEDGATYEGSYIWSSDLDNYARISGIIVKRGEQTDNPGLECLFIDHSDR